MLPFAVYHAGLVLGLGIMVAGGALSLLTMSMLVEAAALWARTKPQDAKLDSGAWVFFPFFFFRGRLSDLSGVLQQPREKGLGL